MIHGFLGPATKAIKAFRWARGIYRDDKEMSRLLDESCAFAVAAAAGVPLAHPVVEGVVGQLAKALDEIPFPDPNQTVLTRVVATIPGLRKLRRRPRSSLVNEPDPIELIEKWILLGLKTDAVQAELSAFDGHPPLTPESVAERFRKGFATAILSGRTQSLFRAQLVADMTRRESELDFLNKLRAMTGAALGSAATLGGISGAALDLTHFSTPTSALIGAGVGLASAGVLTAVARTRGRWTSRSVVKEAALGFVGEVLDSEQPLPPLAEVLVSAITDSSGDTQKRILSSPADLRLVDELRERLIPDAERAGEQELATVLTLLDDRLRRWARHPEWELGKPETRNALLEVIRVAQSHVVEDATTDGADAS